METIDDLDDTLAVDTLADALGIGLDLLDLFGPDGDFCAMWLGDDVGRLRDFVVFTDHRGRDVDRLVTYASAVSQPLGADRVVLWRTAEDLTDAPTLATAYFDRRERLENAGVELIDEIIIGTDELRSTAITTFTDAPGWDDVSEKLGPDQ